MLLATALALTARHAVSAGILNGLVPPAPIGLAVRLRLGRARTTAARAAVCSGEAGRTSIGLPTLHVPRTIDPMANCNLCASCVKPRPNDAISITVRPPTHELWLVGRARIEESLLAMAIMGIVLIQNLTMLGVRTDFLNWLTATTGISSYPVVLTVGFALAVVLPVGVLALASRVAAVAGREDVWKNFARFGYALIPLDVAAHLAHNLFHLLAEGKAVVVRVGSLVGIGSGGGTNAIVGNGTIQVLQDALVALGAWASVYVARKIAVRRHGGSARAGTVTRPYVAMILLFAAVNAVLFALPMVHRV